ncbi:LytR/AlgR family response regulator transcription factor [Fibrella forsythiae]|uniref:Response regulator transcription factor n=1 Tax=Fibrella forsythiae TaxID=2817061 RepID=A0ABS3JTP9_9BACT|nr:LytTR family DNA-binding domain-containing protein [Fibrella forsythiae]MBO0952277.1 response regulator transcription factor [Fibrella forsythiae]
MRCIAIDDEPFALELIADDIRKIPFLNLVGHFNNPLDAYDLIRRGQVDLIFLDIQMPTLTGLQFLRTLTNPPMVILTTAYEEYALDGYTFDVVDYLLKPIPFERFLKAVSKAYDLFLLRQGRTQAPPDRMPERQPVAEPIEEAPAEVTASPEQNFFFVFSEYQEIRIFFDDVLYVEGLKDYVKIYTSQQVRPILSRLTLKAIEAKLPEKLFCRVHKSFIVALPKITAFQRTRLFIGPQEIPVGSSYVDEFERQYGVQ